MKELKELIEKLEAATGRDRGLDELIAKAVGTFLSGRSDNSVHFGQDYSPAYTTSIDAALTLVPEGAPWSISQSDDRDDQRPCSVVQVTISTGEVFAPTPALALCIAALKAHEVKEKEDD